MPVLTRRRLTVASVVFALTAVVGVTYYLLRSTEKSTSSPAALVVVDPCSPALLQGTSPVTAEEAEMYRKTQAALVKSEFVVRAAMRDPHVREVVRGRDTTWLTERITVEYGNGSQILRIGVTGVPPTDAALLTNAVAEAYAQEALQMELSAARQRMEQLTAAQMKLQRALDGQREALQQKAAATGVPSDRADQRALLTALYQERAGLRVELAKGRATDGKAADKLKPLQDDLVAVEERIAVCERPGPDAERAEVARLETAVSALSAELTRMELNQQSLPRVRLLQLVTDPQPAVAKLGPN